MSFSPSLSPCAAIVRAHDYDRYLCTLFAPGAAREAWFALFAFNHEIAAIPEAVSEEMIGFMRFAWWREALDEIAAGGHVRRHPVVQALAEVMKAHCLSRTLFDAMLDAREAAFAGEDFTETTRWAEYFRATCGSLFHLCAEASGMADAAGLDALGIAWAAIGTARVCRQGRQEENVSMLMQLAEDKLKETKMLSPNFAAFSDAAGFYLKRLKKCRDVGRRTQLPLTLTLCAKQVLRCMGIIKIDK